MEQKNDVKLVMASVLSTERKICVSDGLLLSGSWNSIDDDSSNWNPISVIEKSVRGTISNRISADKNIDNEVIKSNPQTVDFASLNFEDDTLKLSYNVRICGNLSEISNCNDIQCLQSIKSKIKAFENEIGYSELSKRYAYQILLGRALWRNRIGAEKVVTKVKVKDEVIEIDSLSLSSKKFDLTKPEVVKLAKYIETGLMGNDYIELEVFSFARLGKGQEVFPSQEMFMEKSKGYSKSKYLYKIKDCAAMHSQKISNAIRTIDTWYEGDDSLDCAPIPIEVYGSVTTLGKAFRKDKNLNFYDLFDKWIIKNGELTVNEKNYVIAILIRGGIFGKSNKE